MSDSITLPLKVALTGPIFSFTLVVISVSESFSSDSQPGMHCFSTSASLSAAHTVSRLAAMRSSPVISMLALSLIWAAFDLGPRAPQRTSPLPGWRADVAPYPCRGPNGVDHRRHNWQDAAGKQPPARPGSHPAACATGRARAAPAWVRGKPGDPAGA